MFKTREDARAWVIEQKKTHSYRELSERLGLPMSTIRAWCAFGVTPRWETVEIIDKARQAEKKRALEEAKAAREDNLERLQKALLAAGAKRRVKAAAKATEALPPEPGEAAPFAPPPSINHLVEERARAELASTEPNVPLLDLLFRWMSRP